MVIYLLLIENQILALDLGTYANTFTIKELDLLDQIKLKLNQMDKQEFEQQYAFEVKKQIDRPNRVNGIAKVEKDAVRKFDPTVILAEDILIPNETTGIDKVLYPKGTKINPLDHDDFDPLIFIDGDEEKQIEFAHNYNQLNQNSRIILVNGNPGAKQIENKEYYYYFDQGGVYTTRFKVDKVPAIVHQEKDAKVLTITEVVVE